MKKFFTIIILALLAVLPFAADRLPQQHLLITEVAATSQSAEYYEIYNPTDYEIDLSNVYVTDATSGTLLYYKIVTGANQGGSSSSDFHGRFPNGTKIAPKSYIVVAMRGDYFYSAYGEYADFAHGTTGGTTAQMIDVSGDGTPDASPGLTDDGEVLIMYYWDGVSDLVKDIDYFVYGDKVEGVSKTGITIDGPDADTDLSAYADETSVNSQTAAVSYDDLGNALGNAGFRYYTYQRTDYSESTESKSIAGNGIYGDDETSENCDTAFTYGIPTPWAAYTSAEDYADKLVGAVEDLQSAYVYYDDVTVGLYPYGTDEDDIIFGLVSPVISAVSDYFGYNNNILFEGLTEGATYTLFCLGNGRVTYDSGTGGFLQSVMPGDYFYIPTTETFDALGPADELVQNVENETVTFTWDTFTNSETGWTADTYLLKIYDGETIEEYAYTNTDPVQMAFPAGDYKWVLQAVNTANGNIGLTSYVYSFSIIQIIKSVTVIDLYTIKVDFNYDIEGYNRVEVDSVTPMAMDFTPGSKTMTLQFASPFVWGSNDHLFEIDDAVITDLGTFDETTTFDFISPFNLLSAEITDANHIELTFSENVDDSACNNIGFYQPYPTSIEDISGAVVTLYFGTDLSYGTPYDIYVSTESVISADGKPINDYTASCSLAGDYLTLDEAEIIDYITVELTFSGDVDPVSAGDPANYGVSPVLDIDYADVSGDVVTLYFASELVLNTEYTITANIEDTLYFDIDSSANTVAVTQTAVYPKVVSAKMINEQTVSVTFSKDMYLDFYSFGVKDSWLYFVYMDDFANYHYVNMVDYDIESRTATLHLDSPMTMQVDNYIVEASGWWTYGEGIYPSDTEGYDVSQSGEYLKYFSTEFDDLEMVHTYPSPATGDNVTFTNLVGTGTISVFTVSGVKVLEEEFDATELTIDLKNPGGATLVSGVYLYSIDSDKGKRTGTFAILK